MMNLLTIGVLFADPVQRISAKGSSFATFSLRTESCPVSCIVFALDAVEEVMRLHKGDPLSVTGRCELKAWTGRDGAEHHGLSCTVDRVLTVEPIAMKPTTKSKFKPRSTTPALAPLPPGDLASIPSDLPS